LLGSSLKRVVDVAQDIGLMEGVKPFISEEEYGYIPREEKKTISPAANATLRISSRESLARAARA
ncbi:MBL fold metallo-hydrolase, partial [Rhizobium johnstonii]